MEPLFNSELFSSIRSSVLTLIGRYGNANTTEFVDLVSQMLNRIWERYEAIIRAILTFFIVKLDEDAAYVVQQRTAPAFTQGTRSASSSAFAVPSANSTATKSSSLLSGSQTQDTFTALASERGAAAGSAALPATEHARHLSLSIQQRREMLEQLKTEIPAQLRETMRGYYDRILNTLSEAFKDKPNKN